MGETPNTGQRAPGSETGIILKSVLWGEGSGDRKKGLACSFPVSLCSSWSEPCFPPALCSEFKTTLGSIPSCELWTSEASFAGVLRTQWEAMVPFRLQDSSPPWKPSALKCTLSPL